MSSSNPCASATDSTLNSDDTSGDVCHQSPPGSPAVPTASTLRHSIEAILAPINRKNSLPNRRRRHDGIPVKNTSPPAHGEESVLQPGLPHTFTGYLESAHRYHLSPATFGSLDTSIYGTTPIVISETTQSDFGFRRPVLFAADTAGPVAVCTSQYGKLIQLY